MSKETRAVDVKDEEEDSTSCCSYSQEIESLSEENRGVDLKDEGADVSSSLSDSKDIESLSDQIAEGEEGEGISLQSPSDSFDGSDHEFEDEKVEPSFWWSRRLKELLSGVNLDNITIDLPKIASIVCCPKCNCYLQPSGTWIKAQVGSKELLIVCMESVKIWNEAKLVNAEFIDTDPRMNNINVKLTLHKDAATGVVLVFEQDCTIEFVIQDDMCESCSS